jgi:hypothetical protein
MNTLIQANIHAQSNQSNPGIYGTCLILLFCVAYGMCRSAHAERSGPAFAASTRLAMAADHLAPTLAALAPAIATHVLATEARIGTNGLIHDPNTRKVPYV